MSPLFRILTLVVIFLASEVPAHAYIDPTSGGLALQAAVALLLGAGIALRAGWHRIGSVLNRLFRRSRD